MLDLLQTNMLIMKDKSSGIRDCIHGFGPKIAVYFCLDVIFNGILTNPEFDLNRKK